MREAENIRKVESLSVGGSSSASASAIDWMGFIFAPKSSRYVSDRPAYLPSKCKRVGVFVDADIETVRQIADDYALDIIQLHGNESPDYLQQLRSLYGDSIAAPSPRLIKAFPIATAKDLEQTSAYAGLADYFLFDTKAQLPGGNGTKFDWSVLSAYRGDTPFLLSGGIGPDDAERVLAFRHPRCIGIDLNSRFELSPALKDINALHRFLKNIY